VRFTTAIDAFIADWRREGRINSDRTEIAYRSRLADHAQDVGNRDPRTVGRSDVKRTLRRWEHPNTQRHAHAVLRAFYDWAMEEGIRRDNPARQVRKAKARPTHIQRLTRHEIVALMDASMGDWREQRAIHLGVLAGLRSQEMRGLRGLHLARTGFVHVTPDIAKGQRERWVPVLAELEDVVSEIVEAGEPAAFVLPGRHPLNPPLNTEWRSFPRPMSAKALWEMVVRVGKRAGITTHVHPHLLRHAYGDHVAKHAGLRAAQALLGHVSVDTTAGTYVDRPTLDELAISVHGFSYRGYPLSEHLAIADEATTGIEPVQSESRSTIEDSEHDDADT
jgi:site-specific recombinase XerD